jgi:hypothetical protein
MNPWGPGLGRNPYMGGFVIQRSKATHCQDSAAKNWQSSAGLAEQLVAVPKTNRSVSAGGRKMGVKQALKK